MTLFCTTIRSEVLCGNTCISHTHMYPCLCMFLKATQMYTLTMACCIHLCVPKANTCFVTMVNVYFCLWQNRYNVSQCAQTDFKIWNAHYVWPESCDWSHVTWGIILPRQQQVCECRKVKHHTNKDYCLIQREGTGGWTYPKDGYKVWRSEGCFTKHLK